MKIIKATDYFQLAEKELKDIAKTHEYTKEENLILDSGLVVHWYKELEELRESVDEITSYIAKSQDDIYIKVILQTTKDQYALVLA